MSLRGGEADEAISKIATLHFAPLAMTPNTSLRGVLPPLSLRGGEADEAISEIATLHFAPLAMTPNTSLRGGEADEAISKIATLHFVPLAKTYCCLADVQHSDRALRDL